MDPLRFQQLLSEKSTRETVEMEYRLQVHPVPARSTPFALEILREAESRRLSGGEVLCLFEEAALHDLGAVAHRLRMERVNENEVCIPHFGVPVWIEDAGRIADPPGSWSLLELRAWARGETLNSADLASRLTRQKRVLADLDPTLFSDRICRWLHPGGPSAEEWIDLCETVQSTGVKTPISMACGHVENYVERVEHLLRVRESQDRTHNYDSLSVWVYGNDPRGQGSASIPVAGPGSTLDYLRTVAIARISLDNLDSIRASWRIQGAAAAQMALVYGANELDAPESKITEGSLTRDDLNELIRNAGFKARSRTVGLDDSR